MNIKILFAAVLIALGGFFAHADDLTDNAVSPLAVDTDINTNADTDITPDTMPAPLDLQWGRAYIVARPNPCRARFRGTCTTYLQWSLGQFQNRRESAVVTVTSRNEGREKIFACNEGRAAANWIVAGDQYIFRLYAARNCNLRAVRRSRPVAETVVYGSH